MKRGKKMREWILYSRLGRTAPDFVNLHDAGRLDIVYECTVAALFLSHGIRKGTQFHTVLSGPPNPPVNIRIDGSTLHDVRTDQQTWTTIMRKILSGKSHPGITTSKTSFEALLKQKTETNPIYVLEEGGKPAEATNIGENPIFILGDHIGLPKTVEKYALRYGTKISLGKTPYLAATCITILNYLLDKQQIS